MNEHTPTKFAMPSDFMEHAAKETNIQLSQRYGFSRQVAARLRKEAGLASTRRNYSAYECPADFRQKAIHKTNAELCTLYDVGDGVISRWRKECGIAKSALAVKAAGSPYARVLTTSIPPGRASAAANFLRSYFRPVYNRVIEDKKLDGEYVVGNRKMSKDEMIALAASKGFDNGALYL